MICDSKVSALKERKYIDKLRMDGLHGILIAYEMRREHEKPSRKEETFTASKKTKKNNQKAKYFSCSNYSEESYDDVESNFVRKLKRGTGKFKGKLSFKCSNCGNVGHFSSKCPYGKG